MKKIIFILLALFLVAGCKEEVKSLSAKDITAEFWKSYMKGDFKDASNLTVYGKIDKIVIPKEMKIKFFQIGDEIVKDGKAKVKTTLKLARKKDAKDTIEVTFDTVLLLIKDKWKVDFDKTSQNLIEEVAKLEANQISDTIMNLFLNGVKNVKEFQKIFEDSFKEINKRMQKAFEQMQKELEKMEEENFSNPKSI